jgi:hypothetical protein
LYSVGSSEEAKEASSSEAAKKAEEAAKKDPYKFAHYTGEELTKAEAAIKKDVEKYKAALEKAQKIGYATGDQMSGLVKDSEDVKKSLAKDDAKDDDKKAAWKKLTDAVKTWSENSEKFTKDYETVSEEVTKGLKKEKAAFDKAMEAAEKKVKEQKDKDAKKTKENK